MSASEIISRLTRTMPCPQSDCDGTVAMTLYGGQFVYQCGSCAASWDQDGQPLGWAETEEDQP